jgi:hypothetical protein
MMMGSNDLKLEDSVTIPGGGSKLANQYLRVP